MQRIHCRRCKREIILIPSRDTIIALDPEPHSDGQYAIVCDLAHLCVGMPLDRVLPPERYINHLATCEGRAK